METQIAQFRFRRGNKVDLPTLAVGEPGLSLDTNEIYVGSTKGNIKVAQDVDVDKVKQQLEETYFETATGTGNAITLTISNPIPSGYIVNFVAIADNNGTATTINSIPVYKPGTTITPVFVKDNAYTVYYNSQRQLFYATSSSDRFVKDGGNVATIQAGLRNARPSSITGGGIYIATDTQETYSYDGTTWKVVGRSPYTVATETADGLMSKDDKKNLRLVQEGVTALNGITGTHTSQIAQAQTDINTNRNNAGNLTSLDQKIKDGGASSNLVSAINFTLNYLSLGDIKNLVPTQSPEGTTIILNWANPTSTDFIKAEIFMSKTDITNFDYASCVANVNVTKVVDEKTTTKTMVVPQTGKYYFRAFATYNVYENIIQSKGITTNITTVDQVPPGAVTNLVVKEDNATVTLTWSNPSDVDLSGIKIMRKVGSYPANQNDGTVVLNTIATTLVDTGLTNGTTYYYRLFPFDVNGNYNTTPTGQQITATPDNFKIYGVKIEKGNSNPDTRVTYIEQAVGKTPAPTGGGNTLDLSYGSWKDTFPFNLIKPCLVTRTTNTVVKYLNPNNLDQDTTGTSIESLKATHNVMIEFPKIYFSLTSDATHLYIRYSDKKVDSSYTCLAHLNDSVEKDKLYLGAYLSGNDEGKYHSWSGYGKSGVASTALVDGLQTSEYFLQTYRHVVMLQALFVILYKSTDSQNSLGKGQLSPNNPTKLTGDTATKGMNFGTNSLSTEPISFLGLEDFWGASYTWIYGMTVNGGNGSKVYIDSGIRANTGTQILIGDVLNLSINTAGYIDGTVGNGNAIFLPNKMTGSSSTYYCDTVKLNSIGTTIVPVALASKEGSGDAAGIFSMEFGGFGTTSCATRLALFL